MCMYLQGYNGGYGHAGFGLGPRFGNGQMKGPKQGENIFTFRSHIHIFR